MSYKLLDAQEVRKAIRFESPARPPLCEMLWHNQETLDDYEGEFERLMEEYPDDVLAVHVGIHYDHSPVADDPNYCWAYRGWKRRGSGAIDNCPIINDWHSELELFLRDFPDAGRIDTFEPVEKAAALNPQRYILVNWGHYFHQRLCYLRGTENLLYDFYDHRAELKIVMDALLDFYRTWAKHTVQSGGHGVWAGDDLGMQTSLFMAPDVFRTVYKPYYAALAEILHENGLDFWLHTCGNVFEILEDLIEAGVDVLHPIQVGCMDPEQTMQTYGGRIAFWAGMDVQNLIPFQPPDRIYQEIQRHAQIFYRPEGGIIYGAGNAVMAGAPLENIQAYVRGLTDLCISKKKGIRV